MIPQRNQDRNTLKSMKQVKHENSTKRALKMQQEQLRNRKIGTSFRGRIRYEYLVQSITSHS
jgi:hypothetical protein